jgi:long-chain acyl-CoA synthetase
MQVSLWVTSFANGGRGQRPGRVRRHRCRARCARDKMRRMDETGVEEAGVLAQARQRPDVIALRVDEDVYTYRELSDAARDLGYALHGLGVRRGDRVGILVPNSAEFFMATHACGRLGAIVVPVNIHFKADEAGWVITDSGATAVVVTRDLLPALEQVPDVPRLVVEDGWPAGTPEVDPPEVVGDAWPTTMAYTSGTTGRPKGVAMGPDDMRRRASGVVANREVWGIGAGTVHLMVGPAYHAGPSYWAQMHLAIGATVVVMRRWDAETALALIERWRVTTTHMVPANFQRILALPDHVRARYDVSSLKLVVHAAAPCPVPLKRAFMDYVGSDKVWEYYGASEGGGTVISPQEWLQKPGSVGKPFPGHRFLVLDDDGRELPPGEVGTLWVAPAGTSFEYHNDPEKTAAQYKGEFFTVGDAAYLDEDGYLFLADRKSDMVISGGVNIYPREIEECLLTHPEIVDCAVLGVPDDEWGEVLLAIVQPRDEGALVDDEVVAWVRDHLADFKRPRLVEFVAELPRDPNGKVRKPRLREAYLAERNR